MDGLDLTGGKEDFIFEIWGKKLSVGVGVR